MTTTRVDTIKRALACIDKAWTLLHNEGVEEEELDPVCREVYNPQKYPKAYLGNHRVLQILVRQSHDTEA